MKIETKYHYEKVWRETSEKDVKRMIQEELSEAPVEETYAYIVDELSKNKVVRFMEVAFRRKE